MLKPGRYTSGPAMCKLKYSQAVPGHLRGRLREITHLVVPDEFRRQGHANRLIGYLCCQADDDSITLLVMPNPWDIPELSRSELSDWYQRSHGFVILQLEPVPLLVRQPRGHNGRSFR